MKVGDVFTSGKGVDGTPIPVGAIVRYDTGVDGRRGEYLVVQNGPVKALGHADCPMWIGHAGPMTILALP